MEPLLVRVDGLHLLKNNGVSTADNKFRSFESKTIVLKIIIKEEETLTLHHSFLYLDAIFLYNLLKTLLSSVNYRTSFIDKCLNSELVVSCSERNLCSNTPDTEQINSNETLHIFTDSFNYMYIDKKWNEMLMLSVNQRINLDETMSWLSTLGGACSALGDRSTNWADKAQLISFQQMNIALSIGDPGVVSRCKLYFSIAAIQKGKYKLASRIIKQEFMRQKSVEKDARDIRLTKMCLGIWEKLQYTKSSLKDKL